MSNFNLRQLPEGIAQRIKIQAAIHGETMRQYIIDSVLYCLEADEKDNPVTRMNKKP